jgi:hypothetical protein
VSVPKCFSGIGFVSAETTPKRSVVIHIEEQREDYKYVHVYSAVIMKLRKLA